MYTSRNNVKHQSRFMRSARQLAAARLEAERTTNIYDEEVHNRASSIALDLHALSIAALSKRGNISKGRLELAAVKAMHEADLYTSGELILLEQVQVIPAETT